MAIKKKPGGVTGKGFQPGVSGNPKGRARSRELTMQVKEALAEENPMLKKTLNERLIEQCSRRALQGSVKHLELLWAYGFGRPKQSLDLTAQVLTPEQYVEHIEEALAVLPVEDDEQPSALRVN